MFNTLYLLKRLFFRIDAMGYPQISVFVFLALEKRHTKIS
jgi:hypothetical protein